MLRLYKYPGAGPDTQDAIKAKIQKLDAFNCDHVEIELCYYIASSSKLDKTEKEKLCWIFGTPFEQDQLSEESHFNSENSENVIEIGPRLNFSTPFSTNAVSICKSIGLDKVYRIEMCTRYSIKSHATLNCADVTRISALLHDRMTQCRYTQPIKSFKLSIKSEPVYAVNVMEEGRAALEKANQHLGLAFDDWDMDYYTDLFVNKVKRNPTSVECFDLAQSNSEHSRHWFFNGKLLVDGKAVKKSLFKMVKDTQQFSNNNNIIKFSDNSSGIDGHQVTNLFPTSPGQHCGLHECSIKHDIIFTAETHNFPTGVAPFSGATTGTGGRIRDVQGAGKGGNVVAGTAGYCFGNLNIPGYNLEWEDKSFEYPDNFARPVDIAIQASNGASDYGNKFGEPVLCGFARSFGQMLPSGERREWVKPIMFSAGIGTLDSRHIKKDEPEKGMLIAKIGGPVYRIGVGGGAASSIQVQGDNAAELDFGAVQRGDAEMEQKLNRLIRACVELGYGNPIRSIHDQGAGGNGNVLKEICEPAGAVIYADQFALGDPTLSLLELWGAEYQESDAILIDSNQRHLVQSIADRERCPVAFVGEITGDGKICLKENSEAANNNSNNNSISPAGVQHPVDLELKYVLGSMPQKEFVLNHAEQKLLSLEISADPAEALNRVLRLPSVGSKRYLTNKVDRSVTGLIAQQQCVGPLHTPLADVAVVAMSHSATTGSCTSIGEQPIKGLIDAARGARMTVAEALTNIVFAKVSDIKDIKCSGNWMWAAKLPGEGVLLYDACKAMCDVMKDLGIAIDGGKDSLSMAARVDGETVKAPGCLVVSAYAPCPDITLTITPDFKCPNREGCILHVNLAPDFHRLGGTALAQCYKQLGDSCSDLENPKLLVQAFNTIQTLLTEKQLSAGHDISDGGLVTAILEMAFAGNCGAKIQLTSNASVLETLFCEELGFILEASNSGAEAIIASFAAVGVDCRIIGSSVPADKISISVNNELIISEAMTTLRDAWEQTSYHLEFLQAQPSCVNQEAQGLKYRKSPPYFIQFDMPQSVPRGRQLTSPPAVGIIREEGSNGDREMASAFHQARFNVYDITMQDLCDGKCDMNMFRGIAFVGGFSYADVCGSAKGWAATIKYNTQVRAQLQQFYTREDTFSLGVCNGCQLMGLMGWVAPSGGDESSCSQGLYLSQNVSQRFESRFSTVRIGESPSIMMKDMDGSVLGVWVAHGEGRMIFKNEAILNSVQSGLVPLHYVDDNGDPTTKYPMNPNGSVDGIAGVCSLDGRHLAMMPHPERSTRMWQWPWMPTDWEQQYDKAGMSPWAKMFTNAYDWCIQ